MKLSEVKPDNKTKKWMKMADGYYRNIVNNIKKYPKSEHAFRLAKALKQIEAETSKDM